MLAAIINSHSHFYLSACSPSTPTEAGPGLQAGDTAASMTQGRRAEAPSGPGAGVTPPPTSLPPLAAPAASAVHENGQAPPVSPGLLEQAPPPPGPGRPPSQHWEVPWAWGLVPWARGDLGKPLGHSSFMCHWRGLAGRVWGFSSAFSDFRASEPQSSPARVWDGPEVSRLLRFN